MAFSILCACIKRQFQVKVVMNLACDDDETLRSLKVIQGFLQLCEYQKSLYVIV